MRLAARLFVSAVSTKHQPGKSVKCSGEPASARSWIPACEAGVATSRALGLGWVDGQGCEVMQTKFNALCRREEPLIETLLRESALAHSLSIPKMLSTSSLIEEIVAHRVMT